MNIQDSIYFVILLLFVTNLNGQVPFDPNLDYDLYRQKILDLKDQNKIDKSSLEKANRLDWMYRNRLSTHGDLKIYQKQLRSAIKNKLEPPKTFTTE